LVLFVFISVLQTANFQTDPENELLLLKKYQPDKPGMVMEYWSGWFDHWFEPQHHTTSVEGNGQYIMYATLISLESLSSVGVTICNCVVFWENPKHTYFHTNYIVTRPQHWLVILPTVSFTCL
jgi:hypothetical protein